MARCNKCALSAFNRLNQKCHADLVKAMPAIAQFQFMSLVFAPSPQYEIEYKAYLRYESVQRAFRKRLADWKVAPDVEVKYMTYSDLWLEIKGSMDDKRRQYLCDRYMTVAMNKI